MYAHGILYDMTYVDQEIMDCYSTQTGNLLRIKMNNLTHVDKYRKNL